MSDVFDEDNEEEEIQTVYPSRSEDTGVRPAMATAKAFEGMLSEATKLSKKSAEIDMAKLEKQAQFLQLAEKSGFSNAEIVSTLKDAIALAKSRQDSRALTRLVELLDKIFLQPTNDLNRAFIQLQQNNIKMSSTKKDGALSIDEVISSLPKHEVKKWISDHLEEMINGQY